MIPKAMRDALGIRPGDRVDFALEPGAVRVEPAHPRRARLGLLSGHRLVETLEADRRTEPR